MIEAFILAFLGKQSQFNSHTAVYSYQWPPSLRSGRSFAFYMHGFTKLNSHISTLLTDQQAEGVLITDIKRFYASVRTEPLLRRLREKLHSIEDTRYSDAIENFAAALTNTSGSGGIPVGPLLSAMLGNVALERVDTELSKSFPNKYCRYVDDIFIVCSRAEEKLVRQRIAAVLENEGLVMHERKTDYVSRETWQRHHSGLYEPTAEPQFQDLVSGLVTYLAVHPDKVNDLRGIFADAGVNIPLSRLAAISTSPRWWGYIAWKSRKCGLRPLHFVKSIFVNQKTILQMAIQMRDRYSRQLEQIVAKGIPLGTAERKWFARECRYYANRLLYLRPVDDLPELLKVLPSIDELGENRLLIEAYVSKDVSTLLRYPGRVVSAFAELWSETQSSPPKVFLSDYIDPTVFESLCVLSLYRVLEVDIADRHSLDSSSNQLYDFCAGAAPRQRELNDLSYIDELRTLQLGRSKEQQRDLMIKRFSPDETLSLRLLRLGAGSYVSG
jgi:hypothetical protein